MVAESACSGIISSNPTDVVLLVFAIIVLIVLLWCVWAFFYAIFLFIFSKWDDAKVKSAWNSIRYMIIWLFLTVMLLFTGPTILRVFKVWNSDDFSARFIFQKIGNIVTCFWTGVVSIVRDYPNNNPFGSTAEIISWDSSQATSDMRIYEL